MLCSSACSACPGSERTAAGPYPYTDCLTLPVNTGKIAQPPGLGLRLEGRTLRLYGVTGPLQLAAFAGPAPGRLTAEVELLAAQKVDVALMLGGAGDALATVRETFAALSSLPFPTLVLPGGRDRLPWLAQARAELPEGRRERIVLLVGVRELLLGRDGFVIVPGVQGGRYGLDQEVCGYAADQLEDLAGEYEPPVAGGSRWLLSWEAPVGGVARTHGGVDVGNRALAQFARQVGAQGGLFAWPVVRAMTPVNGQGQGPLAVGDQARDLYLTVPRLGGPALERSDGSRVPAGVAILQLAGGRLRWVGPQWASTVSPLDTNQGS